MISKSQPDNFSGLSLKSSIIKAVTQTHFETYITAFIAIDFKLRGKSCPDGIWDNFLVRRLFFSESNICVKSHFRPVYPFCSIFQQETLSMLKITIAYTGHFMPKIYNLAWRYHWPTFMYKKYLQSRRLV